MRIGLFVDIYEPYISGVVTSVKSLKKALELKGHTVFIITVNQSNHKYSINKKIIKIPGIQTPINNICLRFSYPYKIEKIIKNLNLDIIHSHTEFTIGKLGKNIANKLNIPFIQTFHTVYEDAVSYVINDHFSKIGKKIAAKLITNYYNDNKIDQIIVPSNKIKNEFINKYKIHNPINAIPTGIDLNKFKSINTNLRKKLGIEEKDFVILWIGRLGYEKNVKFLIESHYKLIKKNNSIKLLLVGSGPLKKELIKITNNYHINNNVIFIDEVNHNSIQDYYAISDVFVSASEHETQGLTLIEALASSVPVVCFKSKVFREFIKEGYNGFLFRNKNDYITKILKIANNYLLLSEMKINAKDSSKMYSLDNFANNILSVYEQSLKNKSSNNNK